MAAALPACYHGAMSKRECEELLGRKNKDGAYLIRESESIQGALCLCVYKQRVVYTYRILQAHNGYYTLLTAGGLQETYFKTLDDLIRNYKRKNQGLAIHLSRAVKKKTPFLIQPPHIQDTQPEETAQVSNAVSARVSPGVSARASPGVSARASPGVSARASPGVSARASPGVSARASPGVSARVSPGVSARASPGVSARASPGVSARVSPGVSARASPGVSARVSPGVSARASPGVSARASPGVSARVSPGVSPRYTLRAAVPLPEEDNDYENTASSDYVEVLPE